MYLCYTNLLKFRKFDKALLAGIKKKIYSGVYIDKSSKSSYEVSTKIDIY